MQWTFGGDIFLITFVCTNYQAANRSTIFFFKFQVAFPILKSKNSFDFIKLETEFFLFLWMFNVKDFPESVVPGLPGASFDCLWRWAFKKCCVFFYFVLMKCHFVVCSSNILFFQVASHSPTGSHFAYEISTVAITG